MTRPVSLLRPTLYRFLKQRGPEQLLAPTAHKKFEAEHSNQIWQSGMLYGAPEPISFTYGSTPTALRCVIAHGAHLWQDGLLIAGGHARKRQPETFSAVFVAGRKPAAIQLSRVASCGHSERSDLPGRYLWFGANTRLPQPRVESPVRFVWP
jgi:hypothetical protein